MNQQSLEKGASRQRRVTERVITRLQSKTIAHTTSLKLYMLVRPHTGVANKGAPVVTYRALTRKESIGEATSATQSSKFAQRMSQGIAARRDGWIRMPNVLRPLTGLSTATLLVVLLDDARRQVRMPPQGVMGCD